MDQFFEMLSGLFAYATTSIVNNVSVKVLFYTVLLTGGIFFLYQLKRVLKDDSNPIDWWQFISSPGRDGIERADINKLGQVVGVILVFFVAIYLSSQVKDLSWEGFSTILLVILAYLGGVQGYQSYLKTKYFSPDKTPDPAKKGDSL